MVESVSSASEAIIVFDSHGVIRSINTSAESLFGYTADQIVGCPITDLIPEINNDELKASNQLGKNTAAEISVPLTGLSRGAHKDGESMAISLSVINIPPSAQTLYIAAIQNISSQQYDDHKGNADEKRFRAQYMGIPIPIYSWQKIADDFILVDFNDASIDYTRGAISMAVGSSAEQLYHDEPDILQCFSRCYNEKTSVKWEGEYRFRTGEIPNRFVEVTFGYVAPDIIIVHVVDVDDRKRAEDALRDSEAKWRSITEKSPDHIMLLDLEGKIQFINHTVAGLTIEQVLGSSIFDHISEDQSSVMRDCFHRVLETGQPDQYDVEYIGESGAAYFSSHVGPVVDAGKIVALTVSSRDITKRKQAEQEVQQLNEHLNLLLSSTGEGIFGVDPQLTCTFVNEAGARILGYIPEQMTGQDMHQLVHYAREDGASYARDECLISIVIQDNKSVSSDNEVLWHKDGNSIPVQYSANPIWVDNEVRGAVVVFRDIAEARAMTRKMDYLATHDTLTGLVNRREFDLRLEQSLSRAHTENSEHVLCYLDLDQFKVVNDTCGHVAGDELLRQLASLLREQVHHGDTLARLGGDEFGVLLTECSLAEARPIIENIRRTVSDFRFVWDDKPFTLSVSVGVVVITAETESVGNALSAADSACYLAKDSGRDRVQVYQAENAELSRRHGEMQWVSHIHDAFDQDRFYLHYQTITPICETGGPGIHFEILIRIRDEKGQDVPPGAFIPAAERYNLMPTIDRWVIRTAFKWFTTHPDQLERVELCAINLSGHSFSDESFLGFVVEQITATGMPADKIAFEITETAAVANLTEAARFIRSLKQLGCRFALDDFGSGMSSFAYLKNLPVDYLKIDGNFVRDIVDDPVDYAMVEAINKIGQVMGIKTIAECVESDAILARLRAIGVDYAQGFAISKPKPLMEFVDNLSGFSP